MRKHCRRTIRPLSVPNMIDMHARTSAVFQPVLEVLRAIELSGEVDAVRGRPVFKEAGEWFETAPAIEGICEYCRIASARYGLGLDVRPLEVVASRLANNVHLTVADIAKAREFIASASALNRMPLSEARDVLRTVQTQIALEGVTA